MKKIVSAMLLAMALLLAFTSCDPSTGAGNNGDGAETPDWNIDNPMENAPQINTENSYQSTQETAQFAFQEAGIFMTLGINGEDFSSFLNSTEPKLILNTVSVEKKSKTSLFYSYNGYEIGSAEIKYRYWGTAEYEMEENAETIAPKSCKINVTIEKENDVFNIKAEAKVKNNEFTVLKINNSDNLASLLNTKAIY